MTHDKRHGGLFDRGSADSYYDRAFAPHYYAGATHSTERIAIKPSTPEYAAYKAGYDDNENYGDKKDCG